MAILAQELLAACSVFAIPDNICAMTCRTLKDYRFAYHVPFISSFRKSHHQNLLVFVSVIIGNSSLKVNSSYTAKFVFH